MTTEISLPTLASLNYYPYIDDHGELIADFQGKIGVYAIFNQDKNLQFIGYSRDIYLSLKQHLVRQPQNCYWVKVQTIERPNRTILESIESVWISENADNSITKAIFKQKWTNPIDVKESMTPEEKENYHNIGIDELEKSKVLKTVARRVEEEILAILEARGLKTQIRFNPKLKEAGLLDIK
ncbi:GIY-YIG nuclease family protein [Dolichospermum circinale CS-1225]|uniref:GIY-YIG nuclease family protein n=1 Tax=Dolichospermum circinale CS-537/01 TaxID=3021739 RepID=A0ABT5A7J8_9CYAN|nr:GIY-YIG nuclease family protein [Dolichospermum circinale]MDB9467593.1 GIY-YIG nuclease family protein [Dolichospermum circinale CS-539/09]MDB9472746.1 GIY-YIG nuclease family protein [Dolichospermum circinale CS-539]MDB9487906.1 GIY-YIG nuclease family protein [Dolichospermum circinale CS-537/01]MDB9523281.1 GIY-YIG nuclease family protein [Dolichospermum circinale CS-1225]